MQDTSAQPLPAPHPFIALMIEYQRVQRDLYYLARHYWKRRRRMDRARVRRSRRYGANPSSFYMTSRFIEIHGANVRWGVMNATRPQHFWHKSPPFGPETVTRLAADLIAIDAELETQGMAESRMDEERLTWQVRVNNFDGDTILGVYTVGLAPDGGVFVSGGDYERGDYIHPHVGSDARLCTGDFNLTELLYREGALDVVVTTVTRILNTYNPESAYINLDHLVNGEEDEDLYHCESCGNEINPETASLIEEFYYCSDCTRLCDSCCEFVSIEHPGGAVGDDWYCSGCLERLLSCDNCGSRMECDDSLLDGDHVYCRECAAVCDQCEDIFLKSEMRQVRESERDKSHWLCLHCPDDRRKEALNAGQIESAQQTAIDCESTAVTCASERSR